MAWKIELDASVRKELKKLDNQAAKRILTFLNERLAKSTDPRLLGESLHGNLGEYWKYRVGDYRVVCNISDKTVVVTVLKIGHRREVYR